MYGRPILVVDDDATVREMLCTLLTEEGYPVESAQNGAQALTLMEQLRPSLVVLDMHMPVLDGPGLARELGNRGLDPPILVVTATARSPHQSAADIGAQAGLPKPFDAEELLQAVARLRIP